MKASKLMKGLLPMLALLLTTSVFAANKGPLQVTNKVNVAGTTLAAGDYTVQWEGSGPSVQLNIMQGKKVVATVPAKIVNLDQSPAYDAAIVNTGTDGTRNLSQIRFSGKKMALEVGSEGASGASAGSSN